METCAHSRCPSPSPTPEKARCSCPHCEIHSNATRSPSPSNSEFSGYDPAKTCCGGCHAIKRDPEPSSHAEKAHCSCNQQCQLHPNETRPFTPSSSEYSDSESTTQCHGSCHRWKSERYFTDTRPTTVNSGHFSDQEPIRKRRSGHPTSKREPEHSPRVEQCQCEAHASPNIPAVSNPRFTSPRASAMAAPRPASTGTPHHQCRKASYCETHPETCQALRSAHVSRVRSMPIPARSPEIGEARPNEKPRRSRRAETVQPECTCRRSPSPAKQAPPLRPVSASKPGSLRPDSLHCNCHMDGYYADDSGYYTTYDDDTVSDADASIQATSGHLRTDDESNESNCVYYHRCRPKFECGIGWVCGRK
ncbi:hypothetical protein N7457_007886 [Penicillium paradoxum]|uniref:uncharacterized protein n=1 Tax=Penicillium paradoxum TaxID=176176 RepID=UPI0025484241|nr:uncharacterized protein N7457_007886 [Penicillium paradoxum]KAJ5772990.1 hypothetical protein N7457_007886 [Penicillium paradoxum]